MQEAQVRAHEPKRSFTIKLEELKTLIYHEKYENTINPIKILLVPEKNIPKLSQSYVNYTRFVI